MVRHPPARALLQADTLVAEADTAMAMRNSDADHRRSRPGARRNVRHPAKRSLLLVSVLLTILGMAVFAAIALVPDTVQRISGSVKVSATKWAWDLFQPDTLPEVVLGSEGGTRELNRCTGEFIEMVSYRQEGVLPLYAAHNVCGGDIILGWELGQRVRVEGSDTIYRVVEERHTPKGTGGDLLRGMAGEFMLQTCYYGENRMRFLALAPLHDEA